MTQFSERILNTPASFIREILKVIQQDDIISFAGGLPNPVSFPKEELKQSMERVIYQFGDEVFQYSSTEGYRPLREWVAERYRDEYGMDVQADDVLITTGSQQALDLMGKVLINPGDALAIEEPGYLGAIQAFTVFEPHFCPVPLLDDGIDLDRLEQILEERNVKLLYTVPNFQNPTGLTYSVEKRKALCALLNRYSAYLIEDDPYGQLKFEGEVFPYIGSFGLKKSVLFGTISKIITPGMRLGWICTKDRELMQHLVTAKQAADLHSNIFAQYAVYDYLMNHELNEHIGKIKALYKEQSDAMLQAMKDFFPDTVTYTMPKGGMFVWGSLPEGESSLELFDRAMKEKVAFVPGNPFYVDDQKPVPTFRLNYTNSEPEVIREGIRRLGRLMESY
ncbi:PLP-dependent aminotransferase family protein [Anaerostipes caccae]|uniref:aminotransferase-like domain-containing protein n=1 Tax=Anaerostipes caccae TaxID=105841 RepID=UPI001D08E236|nr:PLP-dependent aminotransferase family protein [Anaerostipes caccae]MCB6294524.1 PLP-dependent aminotransferase family protein [Anaerostipes caccae]MCB6335726.1 PLP-dependent aminotransferase family protein [Anaerostipes caccae]MCB6338829.1 PLP-dependent aminotransferase family protein [Anaerostipes caccae]MCB6352246.1 PLP-dependent aminotransferase family protein [Anaerostipes caccae]MCB6359129.1 PLP-dependent aminotransferase family protein [Anaerostipes caccae]